MESADGFMSGDRGEFLFGDARFGIDVDHDTGGSDGAELADAARAGAFAALDAALDELLAVGVTPADAADACGLIQRLEAVGSRVDAAQRRLLGEVDRTGVYGFDGHTSAKAMMRHVGRLSPGEANLRAREQRTLAAMPAFSAAFCAGDVSKCVVRRLARLHANPRITEKVEALDDALLEHACSKPFAWFDAHCRDLERVLDEEGADQANERANTRRDVLLSQNFDTSWTIAGTCGSLDGARLREVFDHFLEAEWHTDWDAAKAVHGEATTPQHLARTAGQRRFDALMAMVEAGATNPKAAGGAKPIVTDLVIDQETFERELARLLEVEPAEADLADIDERLARFRCATSDGHQVSAREAVLNALTNQIRRVVVDRDGLVIDLGRKQRLFTGSARLAVQLRDHQCFHPSCLACGRGLQVDHTEEWARDGGSTNPGNGARGCGHHNRWKTTHHVTARRRPDGTWILTRPDGTTIE
jgi:5-methylcytosine-specific restriction endonuclease McrA